MGNSDDIQSALSAMGTNKILRFDGGYFSFAFGNEIALCLDGKYFTLNCDKSLWEDVNKNIHNNTTTKQAKTYWLEKKLSYEINDWSNDFDDLR